MARTLADLTLKLSRDLSALEAACTKKTDDIERKRDGALMEIGSAQAALQRYNQGLADAKAAQMKAIQSANELRDNEVTAAEQKRQRAAYTAEQKHRRARDQAFRTRQTRLKRAETDWRAELERISRKPLAEQRALRKAADQRYEEAVEAVQEAYQATVEDARVAHQAALQDVLAEERLSFERANQTAERMISSAVVSYQRAVAQEEARLRTELAQDPEASAIQEFYDRQLSQTRADCERKREALFKKFTEERKKLTR